MAVKLSYLAGAGWQFFNNDGIPLSGGLLYTYLAGTTTPQTTYTSSTGLVANSNPVVLDSAGRTPQQIWLTEGLLYKFVLRDSAGVLIQTNDNIPSINDLANLANTTDPAKGDALVGFRQSNAGGNLPGSVGSTVHKKLQEILNVRDFGAVGDGVTNDSTAFQNAIDAMSVAESGLLIVPPGTFYIGTSLDLASNLQIVGAGRGITTLKGATRIAPNGNTVSSNIFTGLSVANVALKNMTFDGGVYGPTYLTGVLPGAALVDFESSTNVTIEGCDFLGFLYADNPLFDPATNNYKLGALFAFDSSYITVKNVEYVSPTYGNLIMFIECTHVMVDGVKSTFTNTGVNIINETPINIWGDDCQYVTIQNCEIANMQGSAINLGGKGSFIVKNNRFYDAVGAVGGGIDLTNETWVSVSPPEMHNVIIDGNTFTNVQSTLQIGDVRQSQAITAHDIVVTNNTYQATFGGQFGSFLLGNTDFAIVSNNSLNGASIQLNYNNICSVEGNTLYGRQVASQTGISLFLRSTVPESYQYIRNNVISDFADGAIRVFGFFAADLSNIVYSDNDMLYTGVYTPTSGQYITVIPAGGVMTRIPNDFTISGNRLNGASYIPFRGTDTQIFATKFYTGSLSTKVGSFTRDMSAATGTQPVTGVGFKPRAVVFFASQSNTGEASFGFSDQTFNSTLTQNLNVNSRTATSAGTYSLNTDSIFLFESAGNFYTGTLSSLDDDGFTISFTRNGTPTGTMEVSYLALA